MTAIFNGKPVLGTSGVYSTQETVIGTWIDGKPIYRKVFPFTITLSYSDWRPAIDLTGLNIDYLITYNGSIDLNNYGIRAVDNGELITKYDSGTKQFSIYSAATSFGNLNASGVVLFEYTKTTD